MARTMIFHNTPTQQLKEQRELSILKMLRQNARISLSDIAEKTGISIGTAARSLKRSERRYVLKYSSLVDFDKLGYFVGTLFIIRPIADGKNSLLLKEFLSGSRCINTMSRTIDDGIIVEAYFRNMAEFVDFRHFIGEFADDVVEHEIISDVVKEKFMER
ncbi:hypothetical protein COV19_06650 [Candidatus Woesearchaeota archaeon CG10_big_fil_rev_8_21_14_0_10_44_13]|nr:MAG: hypothetical protein COV19_06650 [Candidatus Woesearchaeota archaeon CG10_big_fil_rev_8_21_14_0_10_44_13]